MQRGLKIGSDGDLMTLPARLTRPRVRLATAVAAVTVCAMVLLLPPAGTLAAREEAQNAAEQLFDGATLDGWVTRDGKPVTEGWVVEDGCIVRAAHGGGDILSAREYEDFDLSFEWKITAGVNSGVKYRVRAYEGELLGPEFQIIDEGGDARQKPGSETGSLYALYETSAGRVLKPAGQWNAARVVCRGTHIEHWLNGVKLLEADTASDDWSARLARSKFAKRTGFGTGGGRIMLTDHAPERGRAAGQDKVWFRKLTLRRPG